MMKKLQAAFAASHILTSGLFAAGTFDKISTIEEIKQNIEASAWSPVDYHVIFSNEEFAEFASLVESLYGQARYKKGDSGNNHKDAYYGYASFLVTKDRIFYFVASKTNKVLLDSLLDREYFVHPLVKKLLLNLKNMLPELDDRKAYRLDLKFVAEHSREHSMLNLHQDGADYLFNLVTSAENLSGGDLNIYCFNKKMPQFDELPVYSFDIESCDLLMTCPVSSGIGYLIKENSASLLHRFSEAKIICHNHAEWHSVSDLGVTKRNVVIGRIYNLNWSDEYKDWDSEIIYGMFDQPTDYIEL